MDNKMSDYRYHIDEIDQLIIKLLEQRFQMSIKVGAYKIKNNLSIENLAREQEIINNINSKDISLNIKEKIVDVYSNIFEYSKKIQEEVESEENR